MARTDLQTLTDSVTGLIEAAASLKDDAPTRAELDAIIKEGKFRPAEDESIGYWFARYLTIRESLWDVINDVQGQLGGTKSSNDEELRLFLVGYAADLCARCYRSTNAVRRRVSQPDPAQAQ